MIKSIISTGFLLTLTLASSSAKAAETKASADCTVNLFGTLTMKYSLADDKAGAPVPGDIIKLPKKCLNEPVTFKLKNSSGVAKVAMGHNIVILETANYEKVGTATDNKVENEYVGPSVKNLVIAHSAVVGGDAEPKTTEVTIPGKTFKTGKDYSYVCTFPGHYLPMKGKIQFGDAAKKS